MGMAEAQKLLDLREHQERSSHQYPTGLYKLCEPREEREDSIRSINRIS
jgi:hypothetical protein